MGRSSALSGLPCPLARASRSGTGMLASGVVRALVEEAENDDATVHGAEDTVPGETAGGTVAIERLELRDILSFGPESPSIVLGPLNVLIGPNASGKSNLIRVLQLLSRVPVEESLATPDGSHPDDWIRRGRHPLAGGKVKVWIQDANTPLTYELGIRSVEGHFEVLAEHVFADTTKVLARSELISTTDPNTWISAAQNISVVVEARRSALSLRLFEPPLIQVVDALASIAVHQDWSIGSQAPLRVPQSADLPNYPLRADAANLGLVLNRLNQDAESKKRLIHGLQQLYDGIADLRVNIAEGNVMLDVKEGDFRIPASHLSDGTLRYLCLLAILSDPDPPPLICLEEPELGLHPDILPTVGELLIDASTRCQLIVTTHSDVLVDKLTDAPENVVVCEKHEGQTHMRRLDKDDLAGWLADYSLGQLWSSGHVGGNRW